MPGYYLHLAACNSAVKNNRSFILGVEAPDILKKYVKLYGMEGARDKYNNLKTDEMPSFESFEKRLMQKEVSGAGTGLHYGMSSNPDIMLYWTTLNDEERNNPFYTRM